MGFYELYNQYKTLDFNNLFSKVSPQDIEKALASENLSIEHFIALLSFKAKDYLEPLAQKARHLTLNYFGKTIQLYTPLYLSNYCDNQCAYCGFSRCNNITRRKLKPKEVEKEAEFIANSGLKHILILTGESRTESPLSYLKDCVQILRKYFSSIAIEIYPLTENEYSELVSLGVDGLTIYQETYDEAVYSQMHPAGPKSDYKFRLGAPERGAQARIRSINIGALLGLSDWRKDIFFAGLHVKYLQDNFSDAEVGISIPRIRPQVLSFKPRFTVDDEALVQIILALRIFLPRLSISVSTRESPEFRENLIPLGITRMSAGSTTYVGGHTLSQAGSSGQFEIYDQRSVSEIKAMLEKKGYQPVLKDWDGNF